jgi:two-component system cell cycle sensor histidine kinase/response regulator CckA
LELEPGLPLVLANATQIHQVLLNFCVNSRDAMPQGGVIRMSGKRIILNGEKVFGDTRPAYGDFVRISVEDNGEGMGPETLAKIGQPFFTTKSEGKGTGLGLSTALGIVKNHGGFMDITSERGKGSTFSIYLPCFSSE